MGSMNGAAKEPGRAIQATASLISVGGIFQITWFRKNGVPIGQFNGFLSGGGAFEIGGSCKWKTKPDKK